MKAKTKTVAPDTDAAVKFLEHFHPNGPWHLVAVKDDNLIGQTFNAREPMERWINDRQGKWNIYFHVARLKDRPRNAKAAKKDVADTAYLHVDVDNAKPETLARLRAWCPKFTAIIMSGGGYHGYLKLGEPTDNFKLVETCNKALAKIFDGDKNAHNIDRILRLPGTINLPNASKRAKGRSDALAQLTEADWSRSHDIRLLETLLTSEHLAGVMRGSDTHHPALQLAGQLVHVTDDDGLVEQIISSLLPEGYQGDTKSELTELIGSARRKLASGEWKPALKQVTKDFPDLGKKGKLLATLPNTKAALAKFDVECRYDLFKMRYFVNGQQLESFIGEVSDRILLWLKELIYERFRFDPTIHAVLTAVQTLANHHCFHPVLDYLDSLKWDGERRIDNWLQTYAGAEDNEYVHAVGALVLVAAVRRVRQPGCKFDEILVLENPEQGNNRSSALQLLAVKREWFSDNLPLGLSAKETIEALSGHWIVEASELHGMRNSDIDKVKAFASRDTDRARLAYDRAPTAAPRQCVIIGTTNNDKYLRDRTGNRRFWPVRVGRIDLELLKRDRDQLWAEAAARDANGASIRLPERLWLAAAHEQQQRVIENPFVSVIDGVLRENEEMVDGEWTEGKPMQGKIQSEDVWSILGIKPGQRTQDKIELFGDAMKQLGWERAGQLRIGGGKRRYHYTRGPSPHRRITVTLVSRIDGTPPVPIASYEPDPPY
jgi:hypothetical protein